MNHKYKTSFSSAIKPLVGAEKDEYLAVASLNNLVDFLPDIDLDVNYDLLPIAFDAFVANRANKNDDIANHQIAQELAPRFVNKPINIEHNRAIIVGSILKYGFSEFGDSKVIEDKSIQSYAKVPYNVVFGGVLWKVVDSYFTELIEEASDPSSSYYQGFSASWEVGFSDYDIVLSNSKDLNEDSMIISKDSPDYENAKASLRVEGGEGIYEGMRVYRMPTGETNLVGLGIGLTETPAADVKGVLADMKNKRVSVTFSEDNDFENENKNSQESKSSVNTDKDTKKISTMIIKSYKDITDENLQELKASDVHSFIEEALQVASDEFAEKETKVSSDLEAANANLAELNKRVEDLEAEKATATSKLEETQLELQKLQDQLQATAQEELFNKRMAHMDATYEIKDSARAVIAKEVQELDSEEASFEGYIEKMNAFLSVKEEKEEEVTEEEAQASVKDSISKGEKSGQEAIASTTTTEDFAKKFESAFSLDKITISK